jgi:hypothetical protein
LTNKDERRGTPAARNNNAPLARVVYKQFDREKTINKRTVFELERGSLKFGPASE